MTQEVYFKDIRNVIISNLLNCNYDLKIAVAWFTDEKIISTVNSLLLKGVNVTIVIYDDHINKKDLFEKLHYNKAEISLSKKLMHHKFCIIDEMTVINGSYNWTNNAKTNDENIQISYKNPVFADKFKLEFEKILKNCYSIEEYFKYSKVNINTLKNDFEKFYELFPKYNFPYFLDLRNIKLFQLNSKTNLDKFIYFVASKDLEKKILWYYFLSKRKVLASKIFGITNEELVLPLRFENILDIKFDEFNVSVINKSKYLIEEIEKSYISSKKHLFYIDNKGQIITEKIEYTGLINLNQFYYVKKIYKTGYSDNYLNFIDRNLISTKVDFLLEKILVQNNFATFFIMSKYCDKFKKRLFCLINTNNETVLPLEFDKFLIDDINHHNYDLNYRYDLNTNKYVDFFEFAFLQKCKYSNELRIDSIDQKVRIRVRFCLTNNSVISILKVDTFGNEVDDSSYLFLRDENYKYKDFYLEIREKINDYQRISLKNLPYDERKMKIDQFEELKKHYNNHYEFSMRYNLFVYKRNEKDRILGLEKERNKNNCYVATMVYGTSNHPEVILLRNFRDKYLNKFYLGKFFINSYYKYSPKFVLIAKKNILLFWISKIFVLSIVKLINLIFK